MCNKWNSATCLQNRNLSLLCFYSLVVQLARDLQTDFYPHFTDFFIIITSVLETQDTEVLEWAFTCLSYLYKYLWRLMVKDMDKIYRWEIGEHTRMLLWLDIVCPHIYKKPFLKIFLE